MSLPRVSRRKSQHLLRLSRGGKSTTKFTGVIEVHQLSAGGPQYVPFVLPFVIEDVLINEWDVRVYKSTI